MAAVDAGSPTLLVAAAALMSGRNIHVLTILGHGSAGEPDAPIPSIAASWSSVSGWRAFSSSMSLRTLRFSTSRGVSAPPDHSSLAKEEAQLDYALRGVRILIGDARLTVDG